MISNKSSRILVAAAVILTLIILSLSACTAARPTPTLTPTPTGTSPKKVSFTAQLTGGEEVPVVSTQAQGEAVFDLNEAGTELAYKVTVSNINNLSMSHIHLAAKGQNGAVVVWLYPIGGPGVTSPKQGRFDGVLAEGKITAGNLSGTLQGQPLSALIDKIKAGEAYVNVHTDLNPGGEIRGQLALKP